MLALQARRRFVDFGILMATFADSLRELAYNARAIPGQLGIRPNSVAIVRGTWSGTNTGRGDEIGELWPITEANGQPPKVREINTEELALGNLGKGSLKIGPITPDFPGGGTALADLQPCVNAGQTVHVIVTGPAYPNGAKFVIKSVNADRALHWTLTVEPVSELQP